MEVVDVEDHGVVPLPTHEGNYTAAALGNPRNVPHVPGGPRADLRKLEIIQPEGPSFELSGRELTWQKWRLRIGFTPREGLVLHTVGYEDGGRVRPILYRASLAEMVVPYGDPAPTHWRKNAFDEGEYGVGMLANRLVLGCDCLGEIRYLDAVVSDTRGEPVTLENAVCVHEEDFGILWKHTNFRTGQVEVRRSRRLAISSIATVGNYEYGFFWYLYQDGTIELQIKLTGIVSTGAIAPGAEPEHGVLIAPGLYAPNHQHWFSFRLDMMVDGLENSVYEVNSVSAPLGPSNPHGNAWVNRRTLLARADERRPLVQRGRASRFALRGVAGDARRLRGLSAQARGILRRQPSARRAGDVAQRSRRRRSLPVAAMDRSSMHRARMLVTDASVQCRACPRSSKRSVSSN